MKEDLKIDEDVKLSQEDMLYLDILINNARMAIDRIEQFLDIRKNGLYP